MYPLLNKLRFFNVRVTVTQIVHKRAIVYTVLNYDHSSKVTKV